MTALSLEEGEDRGERTDRDKLQQQSHHSLPTVLRYTQTGNAHGGALTSCLPLEQTHMAISSFPEVTTQQLSVMLSKFPLQLHIYGMGTSYE